jgi:hypothetical protein
VAATVYCSSGLAWYVSVGCGVVSISMGVHPWASRCAPWVDVVVPVAGFLQHCFLWLRKRYVGGVVSISRGGHHWATRVDVVVLAGKLTHTQTVFWLHFAAH